MKQWIMGLLLLVGIQLGFSQTVTLSVVQPVCTQDGILQATINGIVPPYDVHWKKGYIYSIAIHTGVTSSIDQVQNLIADTVGNYYDNLYHVEIVKNGNVVALSDSIWLPTVVYVPRPTAPTALTYTCPAATLNLSLTIQGGTPPYLTQFTDLSSNVVYTGNPFQLPKGYYELYVSDAMGCFYKEPKGYATTGVSTLSLWTVDQSSGINASVITTTANCLDGTAKVRNLSGGMPPYTFQWNNGLVNDSIGNLHMGDGTVAITDGQGCVETKAFYIAQTTTLTSYQTFTPDTCMQGKGTASVVVVGGQTPYTYLWNNGATIPAIGNLTPGPCFCQVIDANGCRETNQIFNVSGISNVSGIITSYVSTPSDCNQANGTATLHIYGNVSLPFSVNWSGLNPVVDTLVSSAAAGVYTYTITDANGCQERGALEVPANGPKFDIVTMPDSCSNGVGTAALSIYKLGSPPYTYLWSNGASTPTIVGLTTGTYSCTMTDANGCYYTAGGEVAKISTLNVGFTVAQASCLLTNDGSAQAVVTNGTPPYSYQWSTGGTAASITGVVSNHYYVEITDASNCSSGPVYVYVDHNPLTTGCYAILQGKVYEDLNTNCQQDPGEQGLPNTPIECSGWGYTYTDANGAYSYTLAPGMYTLTEHLPSYQLFSGCQPAQQTFSLLGGTTTLADFANTLMPVHDLCVFMMSNTLAVPGHPYDQQVVVANAGTLPENTVQFSYQADPQLNLISSTLPMTQGAIANHYEISSGFPALPRFASAINTIHYNVPSNLFYNTPLNFADTVAQMAPLATNWWNDLSGWDNAQAYTSMVVASFDPNFKEVSPVGTGPAGIISSNDSILTYVIHFENTGTYYAENILIEDTLDADLDWTSLEPLVASHRCVTTRDQNGLVKFNFTAINLPFWPSASKGFIAYRIKTKHHLSPGTEFRNKAAIYFDYNAPIVTNTTLNSLDIPGGSGIPVLQNSELKLYPNPANDQITVWVEQAGATLRVCNLLGQVVLSPTAVQGPQTIDLRGWPAGLYLVQLLEASGQKQSSRFVKQ